MLDLLVVAGRTHDAFDFSTFKLAEAAVGAFSTDANRLLNAALSAADRHNAYLQLGAHERLPELPRLVYSRKVHALGPQPSSAPRKKRLAQLEQSVRRRPLPEPIFEALWSCRTVMQELRSDLDRGMTESFGAQWIHQQVPAEMFAT